MSQPQPPGEPGASHGARAVGQPWPAWTQPAPGAASYPAGSPPPAALVAPDGRPLAELDQRLLALLVDSAIGNVLILPGSILLTIAFMAWLRDLPTSTSALPPFPVGPVLAGSVLMLIGSLITYWNVGFRQGATGQSIGKQAFGLRLVREADGLPLGGGMGLARVLIRGGLGAATSGVWSTLTVLWPLWDDKRQTLEDKLLKTLVVSER
jgi:uncharacterized RDD family membrane protein YckC